jgi:hypothetical protein
MVANMLDLSMVHLHVLLLLALQPILLCPVLGATARSAEMHTRDNNWTPRTGAAGSAASSGVATMVHLSLVPAAAGSAVQVSFSTPKNFTGCSQVEFWPAAGPRRGAASRTALGRAVSYAKAADAIHHVQLFGLEPGGAYRYACGCARDGGGAVILRDIPHSAVSFMQY